MTRYFASFGFRWLVCSLVLAGVWMVGVVFVAADLTYLRFWEWLPASRFLLLLWGAWSGWMLAAATHD